jgi:hypothetical protein
MNVGTLFWLVVCALGIILSLRSIGVLRAPSAWTIAGWAFTALYCAQRRAAAAARENR